MSSLCGSEPRVAKFTRIGGDGSARGSSPPIGLRTRPCGLALPSPPVFARRTDVVGDGLGGNGSPPKEAHGFSCPAGSVCRPSPPVAGDGGPTGRTALLPPRSSGEVMPLVCSRSVGHLLRFIGGNGWQSLGAVTALKRGSGPPSLTTARSAPVSTGTEASTASGSAHPGNLFGTFRVAFCQASGYRKGGRETRHERQGRSPETPTPMRGEGLHHRARGERLYQGLASRKTSICSYFGHTIVTELAESRQERLA